MVKYRVFLLFTFLAVCLVSPVYAEADDSCRECHSAAAADLSRGKKAEIMQCTDCHGSGHQGPNTGQPGIPTPKKCAECHQEAVALFNEGKHSLGWEAMKAVPTYQNMPKAVTDKGCVVCHQVGFEWEDGSRGRCDSCHTRHVFSAEEASKPEACATCHTGDHPQYEMWSNSKHGKIYQMEGGSERAPACVDCHENHKVVTAWGFLGIRPGEEEDSEWLAARQKVKQALEIMGPARAPEVFRRSRAEWQALRDEMSSRCSNCHADSFVERELAKDEALLREADMMMAKVIDVADMLYDEELIDEQTRFSIYRESTAHRFSTFMGGFHNSPLYAWDKGYLGLVTDLVSLRDEAITTKKVSVIRGKVGQLFIVSGTALVAALISIGLMFIENKKRYAKKESKENIST